MVRLSGKTVLHTVIALRLALPSYALESPWHPSSSATSKAAPTADVHPDVLNLQASFSKVADLVMPAVVSISTTHMEQAPGEQQFYFGDPFDQDPDQDPGSDDGLRRLHPQRMEGVGSGVIIDPQGLVLTNEHVVRDADQIKVLLYDKAGAKTEYVGKVVGKDAKTDIAVVRIKVGHPLPYAALGNSDVVKVGDWAIAIGSPFGLAQTFTVGVISAARQSLEIEDKEYRNMIQTDAAINRGNSGGPLLNIRGEVVGINSAIYAPTGVFSGIGFAVPINQAEAILTQLIEKGHVTRGWMGVELANMISPAMVRAFGLPDTDGALVNSVMKGSPAEKAGIKRGDVIRELNHKAVTSGADLQERISALAPHQSVQLEIIRDHHKQSLALVLGERPDSADSDNPQGSSTDTDTSKNSAEQKEWMGAHFVRLTPSLAQSFHQPDDTTGMVVTDVDDGSRAEDMGLGVGDIIRQVNDTPTPDAASFKQATSNVHLEQGVVLDVLREGHPIFLSYTQGE